MKKNIIPLILLIASLLLAGCDSDPQTFSTELTDLQVQKKGSDETLEIDGLPIAGATVTAD